MNQTVTTYTDKYGKSLGTKQGSRARSVEEYDDADNLTKHIDNVAGLEYNYEYNEFRDITSYTEKKGTTTRVQMTCTYDSLNRPDTSSYTVDGKKYSYKCNYTSYPDEEFATFVTPLGTVAYQPDELSRPEYRTLEGPKCTFTEAYEYLPNLTSSGYTTQLVKKLEFDTGSQVSTLEYSYDANANIKTIRSGTSEVASYEYDGLNRLTRENIAGKKTVVYSYDGAGNITGKQEYAYTTGALGTPTATKAYVYASGTWGDRLTSYNGESIVYNAAGYPTSYRGSALTWSNGNLTKFGTTTFSYNDAGIRIRKGTTEYFVKGSQILAEKRGDTVIHYYYDDSGVAGFEYNGQKYYYRKNLQGDILAIYDCCGNMLGEYKYDAWGNILSQGGSELLTINPFRYRGYYYDTETGLYYLNSRYYDPETGRFISPDDVDVLSDTLTQPNGLNLYAYCYNNPVGYTDIFGHIPVANAFYKIYQSTLIFGFDSKWWGRINYSVSVPIKQTEEAGIFYSFSALRRTDNVIEGGAGINLWGWFGIEVGYNSGGNLYFSMNVTPWLSSGVSFGADGLTCTLGFNDGKVTHEVNFGIGWGLVILVGGVAAVVLSGGQLLSPVLQFFQKLFA